MYLRMLVIVMSGGLGLFMFFDPVLDAQQIYVLVGECIFDGRLTLEQMAMPFMERARPTEHSVAAVARARKDDGRQLHTNHNKRERGRERRVALETQPRESCQQQKETDSNSDEREVDVFNGLRSDGARAEQRAQDDAGEYLDHDRDNHRPDKQQEERVRHECADREINSQHDGDQHAASHAPKVMARGFHLALDRICLVFVPFEVLIPDIVNVCVLLELAHERGSLNFQVFVFLFQPVSALAVRHFQVVQSRQQVVEATVMVIEFVNVLWATHKISSV